MQSSLLALCHLAVVLSARIDHQPRGLSARTFGPLTAFPDGVEHLQAFQGWVVLPQDAHNDQATDMLVTEAENDADLSLVDPLSPPGRMRPNVILDQAVQRRQLSDTATFGATTDQTENPQTNNAPAEQIGEAQTHLNKFSSELAQSHSALKELLAKESIEPKQAKAELKLFFANMKKNMSELKHNIGHFSSLTGPGKEEIKTFFNNLKSSMTKLQKDLANPNTNQSDNGEAQLEEIFSNLTESTETLKKTLKSNKLERRQEDPQQGKAALKKFFVDLQSALNQLQMALRGGNSSPEKGKKELQAFQGTVNQGMSDLKSTIGHMSASAGPGDMGKEELQKFFGDLSAGMKKLESELAKPKPDRAELQSFFAMVKKNLSSLQEKLGGKKPSGRRQRRQGQEPTAEVPGKQNEPTAVATQETKETNKPREATTEEANKSKADLQKFFCDLKQNMASLKKSLEVEDLKAEKAQDELKAFFEKLIKSKSDLQNEIGHLSSASGVGKEQLQKFFSELTSSMKQLQKDLLTPSEKPDKGKAEVKEFFAKLNENLSNLEKGLGSSRTKENCVQLPAASPSS